MNHISIELCAEDRARLDNIISLLSAQVEIEMKVPKTTGKTAQEAPKEESRATTQAEPKKAPVTEIEPQEVKEEAPAEPKTETPAVSLEQLQGLVVKLATNGKKVEARELVFAYAKSVTDVPVEKRGELYAKLQKLEG